MRLRWTWRLGTIAGIEIGIHPSWLITYALFAWSATIAAKLLSPMLNETSDLVLGALASAVLFASVVVHEFAHAIVARRLGIPIGNITLFLFGGVATIKREPEAPKDEVWMAAAGPLASVVLAGVFFVLYVVFAAAQWLWGWTFCLFLAVANAMLAAFNLLPAFPSDGGRILRALLWKLARSQARATGWAAAVSGIVAAGLAAAGFYFMIVEHTVRGAWWVVIALFLGQAAAASARQARVGLALESMPVAECMARRLIVVPAATPLTSFVGEMAQNGTTTGYPVVSGGEFVGLLDLRETSAVPPSLWATTPVSSVMTPVERTVGIAPDATAAAALKQLAAKAVFGLPVYEGGSLTGVVSQETIFAALRAREAATKRRG